MEYYNTYYEGIFWLPDSKESKTNATMYIDDDGIVTVSSLQSLFRDKSVVLDPRKWNKIPVLFGYVNCHRTSKNYSVRLYDVLLIHQSSGILTKFKYQSSNSLLATTFDEEIGNLSYDLMMLHSDLISNWVPTTGFKPEFAGYSDKVFTVKQYYAQPEQINLFKDENFNIYLFFRASAGYPSRRNSYIKEEVFVNIETTNPYEIKEFYNLKAVIERLFSILLFTPFYSTTSEFRTITGTNYRVLSKNNELSKILNKALDFEIFRENSHKIFKSWFEKQDRLNLLIKNFFSVYGRKGVLVENKFLTYISVLENYHTNNVNQQSLLKERIYSILNNSSIKMMLYDIDKYAEKLKVTRNYHAHLEEKREGNSLNTTSIIQANKLLEFLIYEIILRELNIPDYHKPNWLDQLISEINTTIA